MRLWTGWAAAAMVVSVLATAGCERAGEPGYGGEDEAFGGMAADTITVTGSRVAGAPPPPPPPPPSPGEGEPSETVAAMLAYRYATALELPAEVLAQTHEGHARACLEAGPRVCQVISASVNDPDGQRPSAYLELRAAPAWLVDFRAGLESEAEEAGGRITNDQTSVEDLTANIVDAAARLNARTTLRDRLQTLLETREGDLGELLQVERELARVQEQLDAQASVLAALRQRVDTSTLSLSYQPRREIVEADQFNPIMAALGEVGDVFSEAVGTVILVIAALIPWLILIIPVGWLLLRWIGSALRRRREARA